MNINQSTADYILRQQRSNKRFVFILELLGIGGFFVAVATAVLGTVAGVIAGVFGAIYVSYWLVNMREGNAYFKEIADQFSHSLKSQAKRVEMEKRSNDGKFLLTMSYILSGILLILFILEMLVTFMDKNITNDPLYVAALQRVENSQVALTNHQQSSPMSESQKLADISEHGQVKIQLDAAKQAAIAANQAEHAKWQEEVDAFWSQGHSSGIRNNQVMDKDCTPKKSPYGGGKMTSAARGLCPSWESLKSREPVVTNDPTVQRLMQRLTQLEPAITFQRTETALKAGITASMENLVTVKENLSTGTMGAGNAFEMLVNILNYFHEGITAQIVFGVIIFTFVIAIMWTNKFQNDMVPVIMSEPEYLPESEQLKLEYALISGDNGKSFSEKLKISLRVLKMRFNNLEPKAKLAVTAGIVVLVILFATILTSASASAATGSEGGNIFTLSAFFVALIVVVIYFLNDDDVATDDDISTVATKVCANCGREFIPKEYNHIYCCNNCRMEKQKKRRKHKRQ